MKHPNGSYYKYSYGEAKIKAKYDAVIENGLAKIDIESYQYAPRMKRDDAIDYYNAKMLPLWLNQMDKRIPYKFRKKALYYALGRTA